MFYSEAQLNKLAQDDPTQLSKILSNPHANINTLTFGIEILASETKDEEIFLEPIRILLKHVNAVVREGACLAASSFYEDKKIPLDVADRLKWLASNDPSPVVKECASMALKEVFKL